MVTLGKRARTLETAANPNYHHQINENGETQTPTDDSQNFSGYEQFRAERIKENLDRMQKLGILDLSLKLKSLKPTPKNSPSYRKTPQHLSQLPPSGAIRRSSRLQNATPVSYSEEHLAKRETFLEGEHDFPRECSKPEVYTEEHEKLLGNTERSWTLFVDGYGKDGRRIYDQVKGKTCHQCRQKTLGHRTHCSTCNMVQGQFCGDCLYMRYGEHVLEAKENPNWICPACRGICNCSLCRQAKGWPPTGCLYKKISKLGFKSVAHYLIQSRRSQTDSGKNPGINVPVSAKRTLPFSDMEATAEEKESPESKDDQGLINPNDKDNKTDDESKGKKEEEMHFPDNEHESNIALESGLKPKKKPALAIGASEDHQGSSKPESDNEKIDDEFKGKKEEELRFQENKHADSNIAIETSPESENKPAHVTEASYVHQDLIEA
ncbi:hypothetical protein F0562_003878 [Nyssa sinensis]|uniref:Zinc-finger domain-containing protein n=1 Tax=Nyssa sinensis TaxID=561372 RepID=A0A5J5BWM5_9ASTE|nr:hypothetical protein F0562_003878 [Nyssa sinensis]